MLNCTRGNAAEKQQAVNELEFIYETMFKLCYIKNGAGLAGGGWPRGGPVIVPSLSRSSSSMPGPRLFKKRNMAHHTKILKAQERKRIGFPTDEVNLYISLIENNYYNYLMYEFREYKKFYSKSIEPLSPAEAAVETEINFVIVIVVRI